MHFLRNPFFAAEGNAHIKSILIAVGSPFGADLLGWQATDCPVAPSVRAALARGDLTLIKLDRPGMTLLEHFQGVDHAILLDAVIAPQYPPGTWLKLQREELALLATPTSSHGIGVAEALALGAALGLLPPTLEIWGIVAEI